MKRNAQIAEIFQETALFLELAGENPFKVRAYQNVARSLELLTDDVAELVKSGEIVEVKGIGKNLAEHIAEILKTGTFAEFEKLKKSFPPGLFDLLQISGLGPKKVNVLWKKLKITSLAQLKKACQNGSVAELEGFGEKTQEKILQGLEQLQKHSGRFLFPDASLLAEEILAQLRKEKSILQIEAAGSLRRKRETIGDLDFVISSHKPIQVIDRIASLSQVQQVTAKGETKISVVLRSNINADFRVVSVEEFPFVLHHFTGSKEHNVALRSLANKHDMKINEYGVFRGAKEQFVPCKDEIEFFKLFGLEFIPPELRENMGELEAAAKNKLPKLLEANDIRGLLHNHTTASDGKSSLSEMVEAAKKLGMQYLGINDHSQSAFYAGGLKPDDIKRQHEMIDEENAQQKKFRVLKGIEVDILEDGALDYSDKIMQSFEVVVASIHSRFKLGEAQMTKRICAALQSPFVDILAHPTGRLLLEREGYAVNMVEVLECAAENGVAVEINSNPKRLDLDWRFVKQAKELGVKLVISPDAHHTSQLANFQFGVNIARKGWLEKADVLNCLSVEELLKYFQKMRKKRQ